MGCQSSQRRCGSETGTFSQTYGSILTVILHSNGVPCCWNQAAAINAAASSRMPAGESGADDIVEELAEYIRSMIFDGDGAGEECCVGLFVLPLSLFLSLSLCLSLSLSLSLSVSLCLSVCLSLAPLSLFLSLSLSVSLSVSLCLSAGTDTAGLCWTLGGDLSRRRTC